MFDVLIRNGTVVDGSGRPRRVADVGIEGDRVTLVGQADGASGRLDIDASGKIVCPGVVDPHSHADLSVFRADHVRLLEPLVRQGITTFVGGNCGLSLAPIGGKHRDAVRQYIEVFTNLDLDRECPWTTMGGFLDALESRGVLLNVGVLAPHGLLRINEIGPERRFATDEELRAMAVELERALEEGAVGLSAGLQYYPGSHSDTRELKFLAGTLKKTDGVFACHLRAYSNSLPRAIDEVIEVARDNKIRAQISHIFWAPDYGPAGPYVRAVLRRLIRLSKWWTLSLPLEGPVAKRINQMMQARQNGVQVGMDVMPTTTAFTHLLAFFPPWALVGAREDVIARLVDPEQRARMRRSIERGKMVWPHIEGDSWSLNMFQLMGWESCRIMAVASEKNKPCEGRTLIDIARERRKHPFDAACDLLLEEAGHVLVFASMGEPEDDLTERTTFAAIRHPEVAISTDTILLGMGKPSHLFYGCYPKFIGRYVREKRMLSLETAIRKITSLPADHFRLKGRGRIEKGSYADILVFDLDSLASCATFHDPERTPVGIEHVFINGRHVVDGATFSPEPRPGKVLRHGK
jgi:N-acyl-D-aspartate/D-glutamate deacylase